LALGFGAVVLFLSWKSSYTFTPKARFEETQKRHPPTNLFLIQMRFLGAAHQCHGVLAVGFRGNRLKLLRFLALSLFDECAS
jgi:hypothetical protein